MTIKKAIEICKEMKQWRRGEGKYADDIAHEAPYFPFTYEEAIDILVEFSEKSLKTKYFRSDEL